MRRSPPGAFRSVQPQSGAIGEFVSRGSLADNALTHQLGHGPRQRGTRHPEDEGRLLQVPHRAVLREVVLDPRGERLQGKLLEASAQVDAVIRENVQEVVQDGGIALEQFADALPADDPGPAVGMCDDRDRIERLGAEKKGRSEHVGSRKGIERELPSLLAGHQRIDASFAQKEQRPAGIALHGKEFALAVGAEPSGETFENPGRGRPVAPPEKGHFEHFVDHMFANQNFAQCNKCYANCDFVIVFLRPQREKDSPATFGADKKDPVAKTKILNI